MIGTVIGHFRIESKLGQGGMGVVYKARDLRLNRLVAIKVLPPDKVADPGRIERFIREAKAASALNHPNIVTVYDISSEEGVDFIVMEYIQGNTLEELISSRELRGSQPVRYAIQIADALAKAHSAGIIHRDLKPNNFVVAEGGRIKILDFGLAKLIEPESSEDAETISALQLTEEGAVLGTAPYMSPEQAEGKKLDGRSDIFSFGSVLYEMVTGQRPFTGDSRLRLLTALLQEDPEPPRRLKPSISPDLEKIILRCLRKDPSRRYQTMADLKVALEDVDQEPQAQQQSQPATSSRSHIFFVIPLLLILIVAGYFVAQKLRPPSRPETLRAVPLTTLPGVTRYPSFSPGGNHVVFSWTGNTQNNPDIYVQQIGSGSPLRLTSDPGNDYNPVWSPDDRWIAFLRSHSQAGNSEIRLVPPLGGSERKVTEIQIRGGTLVSPPHLTWCPDSNCLIVTNSPGAGKSDALFLISLETGEKKQLTNPQPPVSGDTHPAISPDGRTLVFRRMATLFTGELYRLMLGEGFTPEQQPVRITETRLDAEQPAWINNEEIVFSSRSSLWRLAVDRESNPERLPFVGEDGFMPVVSRTQTGREQRLVYVRIFQDYNLWRIETSASGVASSTPPAVSVSSTRADSMPHLSSDGKRVAFTSDRSGGYEIWLSDADGSKPMQLTFLQARASGYPHWSPKGDRIAFHSNVEGQWDIYEIPVEGGKPKNLTSHPAAESFPSYSQDGLWIYFNSNRSGEQRIWKMPLSGGKAVKVIDTIGFAPQESHDGKFLYYVQSLDAPSPLWRIRKSGGTAQKVLDGVFLANFAVIDRGIYYIDRHSGAAGVHYTDNPSGQTRLQFYDFAKRRFTTVAENLGAVDLPITVSADGRLILYSRMDSAVEDLMLVENFK